MFFACAVQNHRLSNNHVISLDRVDPICVPWSLIIVAEMQNNEIQWATNPIGSARLSLLLCFESTVSLVNEENDQPLLEVRSILDSLVRY